MKLLACYSFVICLVLNSVVTFAKEPAATPKQIETTGKIPSDAIMIFDGTNTDMLVGPNGEPCGWPVKDGSIVCKPPKGLQHQSLWTKLHFRDAQIHAEFLIPKTNKKGEDAGNSGLYFHGLFEQQILDSKGKEQKPDRMLGALYRIKAPIVNASRAAGEWQSYDIIFKAPRRDKDGKAIKNGSFTTMLNGVVVQLETPVLNTPSKFSRLFFRTTPYSDAIKTSLYKTECGPLQLQDHQNPVAFRNVWIRPLDDKAFVFEMKK